MNRRSFLIALLLVVLVSVSQFILAAKYLEFGFFTDDWLFLSAYRVYVTNPFLDILNAWKQIGSHNFSYSFYQGVLYNFFGLDYHAYRLTNQILKIIATLSLYPLVLYVSKNKLVAFLATILYGIHYSSFGLLDGASRGGNFLAITLMNLFLLAFFYVVRNKISNVAVLFGLAGWMFATIFTATTRLFPLLFVVAVIETLHFSRTSIKRLLILYSPLLLLFLFSPASITTQLNYLTGLFTKVSQGNWQLFLTPFAALGSTYIPRDLWLIFGNPVYESFGSYLAFLITGPIFLFFLLHTSLVFFISKRPLKFISQSAVFNLLIGLFVFWIVHNWSLLDPTTRTPVDPGTFLTPALIGLFVISTAFSIFLEWRQSEKKSNLQIILFIVMILSFLVTFLTWVFADINSIFMEVHAYLNIPSIGTSIVLAIILTLIYQKINTAQIFNQKKIISVFVITLILVLFFGINAVTLDKFFSNWLDNGLRASDQKRIIDQFWTELDYSKNYNLENLPLIYLDTSEDYNNGAFYSETIIWRLASWFDLRFFKNKEGRFALCDLIILDKSELENSLDYVNGEKTFIRYKCNKNGVVYKTENFYAFKLMDRNLIPNRKEVLEKLGIE